jgi:hypothetical protein
LQKISGSVFSALASANAARQNGVDVNNDFHVNDGGHRRPRRRRQLLREREGADFVKVEESIL